MVDEPALIRALAEYARTLSGRYDVGDVLYRLSDQVVEVLDLAGAGVCLVDDSGDLRFVTATDERVMRVEHAQISLKQGPCHDAFTTGARVTATDLGSETRWQRYTQLALQHDCRAVAGLPMAADGRRIGALNLYMRAAHQWTANQLATAQVLADMASGYVLHARELSASERLAGQLQKALDSRVVIEQAKGIIAERHGLDLAEAFERMRQFARANGRKIHDVAAAIVDGSVDP